ncbi:hypothetical protein F9L16_23130 [Agarivorans sp. B2Z047]|uniref:S-adenosylmethionine:tRNA ribosyltransferase-isomerase n=1 Tax=Agarivorans sp. B2Z047 TaxID=2652721 RepID=UPI00128CD8CD|nr:S-adenosylmethionine:tRNA ribosyltransferase-isomerase [Agarivorans sp. B2Z047]MPW31856.1 hypothetical protein [Agarivorans sp. B2Z047]UQN43702.1 S-adenosylmethionine:tRNA ribosyltransferase-isomerase [Agarivorans sp. B2Z047]
MLIDAISYQLPEALISDEHRTLNDKDKLIILTPTSGEIIDSNFSSLPLFLNQGDLLIFNNSPFPATNKSHQQSEADLNNTSQVEPTARKHFSKELLQHLTEKGVKFCDITLHVGSESSELMSNSIDQKIFHQEQVYISSNTITEIKLAKAAGKRVIAVGTTPARAIESWANSGDIDKKQDFSQMVSLLIYPGYQWKMIDGLITHLHLPHSTLLLMVASLANRAHLLSAYQHAIKKHYLFGNYGDTMFIIG